MKNVQPHELDDGATEVVELHPKRTKPNEVKIEEAASSEVGGRMARMRAKYAKTREEYIMVRSPLGAAKVSLSHLPVFSAIWRVWSAKRAKGDKAGATVVEIVEASEMGRTSVQFIVKTLLQSNIIRSVRTTVGWAGGRADYYPTELGIQVYALAETLGPGTSVKVGGISQAWQSRADSQPNNFFQHAALIRVKKNLPEQVQNEN